MINPGRIIPYILKMLTKKPATVKYPAAEADIPENFRGKLEFDKEKCIGCKLCMRDCPANAIEIEKVGEKQFKAIVRLDRCIYCGQCVDSCPKDALKCTRNFELAGLKHEDLKVDI
jgi:formate hydrogenlyase subunit 6/NADH:ubiquinone oxidoreductase subunit I